MEGEAERGSGIGLRGGGVPEITGILTMLYVLPQDPVFGVIFKSYKAALLRTADLGQREGGAV